VTERSKAEEARAGDQLTLEARTDILIDPTGAEILAQLLEEIEPAP
jgi:hypothetical protein